MAERLLNLVVFLLPMAFAIGFLTPVLAAAMSVMDLSAPWGLAPITFALLVAGIWGLVAMFTGRWI